MKGKNEFKLLIHQRTSTIPSPGEIGIPSGSVNVAKPETYAEAAARELQEESGYIVDPVNLRAFFNNSNRVFFFYVIESDTAPKATGAVSTTQAAEIDSSFASGSGGLKPGYGIPGEVADNGHWWAVLPDMLDKLENPAAVAAAMPTTTGGVATAALLENVIYEETKALLPYLELPAAGTARDFPAEAAVLKADIEQIDTLFAQLAGDIKGKTKEADYTAALDAIVIKKKAIFNIDKIDGIVKAASDKDPKTAEDAVKTLQTINSAVKNLKGEVAALRVVVDADTGGGGGGGSATKGKQKGIYNFTGLACYFVAAIQFLNNIDELREAIITTDPNQIDTDSPTDASEEFLKFANVAYYEGLITQITDAQTAWETKYQETYPTDPTDPANKKRNTPAEAKANFFSSV
jgi:ADP-ribose pyrophosphatase YjhB (NUDIX family)